MDYDCILNIFHIFLYTKKKRRFLYKKKKCQSLRNKNILNWQVLFACPAVQAQNHLKPNHQTRLGWLSIVFSF